MELTKEFRSVCFEKKKKFLNKDVGKKLFKSASLTSLMENLRICFM